MQKEGKIEKKEEIIEKEKLPVTSDEANPFIEEYKDLSAKYGLDFGVYLDYQNFGIVPRMNIIRTKKNEDKEPDSKD